MTATLHPRMETSNLVLTRLLVPINVYEIYGICRLRDHLAGF